jgi:hypothetical protein
MVGTQPIPDQLTQPEASPQRRRGPYRRGGRGRFRCRVDGFGVRDRDSTDHTLGRDVLEALLEATLEREAREDVGENRPRGDRVQVPAGVHIGPTDIGGMGERHDFESDSER